MEENEYKSKYNDLTTIRCVFEKALTNHKAKCELAKHFCLADREGYACESEEASGKCHELLKKLRENSIFVLKLHEIDGPLPHNMEIRVQVGGMAGLVKAVMKEKADDTAPLVTKDINGVVVKAAEEFGSLEDLPYSEIIQSVLQFQGRRRRQRLNDD